MARYIKNFLFFLIFIIVMSGCSSKYVDNSDLSKNEYIFQSASLQNTILQRDLRLKKYKELTKSKKNFDSFKNDLAFQDDRMGLNLELFNFYNEWEGVEYKFGGNSKDGIDCSAFIQKAFSEKFDLSMPRTTDMQSELGKEIDKSELKSGDLVFFRTGDTNHVGIYLEDGMFIHASTSNGVTISELDNVYFKENYWTARRIIN
jgi:cell wall-associated NlpC family hydrolase